MYASCKNGKRKGEQTIQARMEIIRGEWGRARAHMLVGDSMMPPPAPLLSRMQPGVPGPPPAAGGGGGGAGRLVDRTGMADNTNH